MDDDSEYEYLNHLQLMLAEQQGDEFEDERDELLACVGLVYCTN